MTTTASNNNEKVLPATKTPARYQESSIRFREAWTEYVEKEQLVKFEIVTMIKILEAVGYTRMDAIKKIVNDHNDLKGCSQATIYRELPDDMKHSQKRDLEKLKQQQEEDEEEVTNKDSDLSNDKSENINITTAYDVKNAEVGEDDDGEQQQEQEQEQEQDIKYDPSFVDRLVKENAELTTQFTFDYDLEIKDQILPLKVTVYPDKKTGYVRLNKNPPPPKKKQGMI